jgi:putative membrane protein
MSDVSIERLTKYLFTAPSWKRSLIIILLLGLIIDGASLRTGRGVFLFGSLGYALPAVLALILTRPLVEFWGKPISWNRSALLAMTCTVFGVIISFSPILLIIRDLYSLLYAISLGLIFATRLLVLVAIADRRMGRMIVPAITQSAAGAAAGSFFFGSPFLTLTFIFHIVFGLCVLLFMWFVDQPLKRSFRISALSLINAFIAHNTDGSRALEEFFNNIGEPVYVPQATLFFRREGKKDVIFTVPNVHPGPMGEIGGGNLPSILYRALEGETFVTHGCATHDFNLVSDKEAGKIIDAVRRSQQGLQYHRGATRSARYSCGSVQILVQGFGDTVLLVSTRSPLKTEDLDFSIGLAILADNRRYYSHVLFVDAHNSMVNVTSPVMPATLIAYEYMRGCEDASAGCAGEAESELRIGTGHVRLPFKREDGFGDLGVQVLVVEAGGQRTAYVLFDGNNMTSGLREKMRQPLLELVDECEVLTTDTHSVNTLSGINPVGHRVPLERFYPHVEEAVRQAIADLSPAEAAGATPWCEGVVVFGSHRISQLASTLNTMLIYIAPLGFGLLLFAFMLSFLAYLVLT